VSADVSVHHVIARERHILHGHFRITNHPPEA
jgi:hypothetical protein